jgi:hypothetical protein
MVEARGRERAQSDFIPQRNKKSTKKVTGRSEHDPKDLKDHGVRGRALDRA